MTINQDPWCGSVKYQPINIEGKLLIEPRGFVNTGERGGDLTAKNDVWI